MIGDEITVTVLGVKGNQARLGVVAPDQVAVHREEVFHRIKTEGMAQRVAVDSAVPDRGDDPGGVLTYTKKPLPIQAMQYLEENRDALIEWMGDEVRHTGMDDDGCPYETHSLFVKTLEGEMQCGMGDWVICGIAGEFYPCKDAIFRGSYEGAR